MKMNLKFRLYELFIYFAQSKITIRCSFNLFLGIPARKLIQSKLILRILYEYFNLPIIPYIHNYIYTKRVCAEPE